MQKLYRNIKSGYLVEVIIREDHKVKFCPQGGGFVRALHEMDFDAIFEPAPARAPFFHATVTADFLENLTLPCVTNGMHWNGWGMPYFEKHAADVIAKQTNLEYRQEGDMYVTTGDDYDEPDTFPSTFIEVEGKNVKVYPIGCGSWTWDQCERDAKG